MFPIRRILVPTDFSDEAKHALRSAVELARIGQSEVVLVHVIEPPVYPVNLGIGPVVVPPLEQDLRERLAQALEQLRQQETGTLASRVLIRDGRPFLEIVRAAADEHADLIVIATHGYTGLKHVLLGSTAERVVREAPCPVLVVRRRDAK